MDDKLTKDIKPIIASKCTQEMVNGQLTDVYPCHDCGKQAAWQTVKMKGGYEFYICTPCYWANHAGEDTYGAPR